MKDHLATMAGPFSEHATAFLSVAPTDMPRHQSGVVPKMTLYQDNAASPLAAAAGNEMSAPTMFAASIAVPLDAAKGVAGGHGAASSMDFVSALFVFMLATFVGLDVIRRVSRLLHTPLMSLTNAISAIAVVGAILVAGPEHPTAITVVGLIAVTASVTNIVSGFLITDRMLKMFRKREGTKP